MEFKCIVVRIIDDWTECMTLEEAEYLFGNELALVLKGRHDFYMGSLLFDDTPLGYVKEGPSLISYEVSRKEFSEYAEQECTHEDRYY